MRRSVSFAVFVAVGVLGASALPAPSRNLAVVAPQKTESAEVQIDNFSFGPPTLTVSVGTTGIWTNHPPENDRQGDRAVIVGFMVALAVRAEARL